jgi:hypothetical protein
MWNTKAKLIPVKTRATGTISESLREYLRNVQGKNEIEGTADNSHTGHCTQTAGKC